MTEKHTPECEAARIADEKALAAYEEEVAVYEKACAVSDAPGAAAAWAACGRVGAARVRAWDAYEEAHRHCGGPVKEG